MIRSVETVVVAVAVSCSACKRVQLGGQDFEEVGEAVLVALGGDLVGAAALRGLGGEAIAAELIGAVGDQGVVDVMERLQVRLLVIDGGFLGRLLAQLERSGQAATLEDRDRDARPDAVGQRIDVERAAELRGLQRDAAGKCDARIEIGLGNADVGGRGVELGIGLADVGAAAGEVGRHVRSGRWAGPGGAGLGVSQLGRDRAPGGSPSRKG